MQANHSPPQQAQEGGKEKEEGDGAERGSATAEIPEEDDFFAHDNAPPDSLEEKEKSSESLGAASGVPSSSKRRGSDDEASPPEDNSVASSANESEDGKPKATEKSEDASDTSEKRVAARREYNRICATKSRDKRRKLVGGLQRDVDDAIVAYADLKRVNTAKWASVEEQLRATQAIALETIPSSSHETLGSPGVQPTGMSLRSTSDAARQAAGTQQLLQLLQPTLQQETTQFASLQPLFPLPQQDNLHPPQLSHQLLPFQQQFQQLPQPQQPLLDPPPPPQQSSTQGVPSAQDMLALLDLLRQQAHANESSSPPAEPYGRR